MTHIAQRLRYFDSGDFRRAIQRRADLVNPIDLSIGVPEELTAEHVKAAGIRAIQEDRTVYVPAAGLPELRASLAEKLNLDNGFNLTAKNVAVVPGLTTGQLLVYLAILDPGDEIIVFDPYYPPYPHLASMVGAKVVFVPTLPNFQPDLAALKAFVTKRTRAIVVNSPNNPTGAVYPEKTLREIAAIASERDITVISDEIYEHFIYGLKHFSIGSVYPNTITLNGMSKEFAMTGWRVGYIAGPTEFIEAISELLQYVVMSSSSISQHAALAALQHRPKLVGKYKAKRDYVAKRLVGMGYETQGMQGAFYAFIEIPSRLTDTEFVELATKHSLIMVPGGAFSASHRHVRISYGADMPTLERGMDALEELTDSLRSGQKLTLGTKLVKLTKKQNPAKRLPLHE